MTGRARESIFSILTPRLAGATVLDLYAGSGSLGLEAISRGADDVTFVERNRAAIRIIEENVDAVGLGGSVVQGVVSSVLTRLHPIYDIVFLDPPYSDSDETVAEILTQLGGVLAPGGVIVLHRQAASSPAIPEFLTCIDERRYGDAVVTMMEKATS